MYFVGIIFSDTVTVRPSSAIDTDFCSITLALELALLSRTSRFHGFLCCATTRGPPEREMVIPTERTCCQHVLSETIFCFKHKYHITVIRHR